MESEEGKATVSRTVWSYDHLEGWKRVEPPEDFEDEKAWLHASNYGQNCASLTAKLYERTNNSDREEYRVEVMTPCYYRPVLICGLPSLMAFLKEILPTLRQCHDMEQIYESFEEEMKQYHARRGIKTPC